MSDNTEQQQNTREDNEDEVSSSVSTKQRSHVWEYFARLPVGPDGAIKASCNACGTVYSVNPNDGTSNMKRHIPKCFDLSEPGPPRKRAPLDQQMYREKLAISIIRHNYPFSFVEHEATRDVHKFLHRDKVPITRNTAKADVLKIHEREKMTLKQNLKKVTSRIWKKLQETQQRQMFTITLDNAKYNDGLVDSLKSHLRLSGALVCNGNFIHVRCGAHILNLIVQAGLKVIEEAIYKIRESVKYVRGGSTRKYKFAECMYSTP